MDQIELCILFAECIRYLQATVMMFLAIAINYWFLEPIINYLCRHMMYTTIAFVQAKQPSTSKVNFKHALSFLKFSTHIYFVVISW